MKSIPLLLVSALVWTLQAHAVPISITDLSVGYSQNFDTLASAGTSSSLPAGWEISESGGNTTYAAGTGSAAAGNTYSFGATASSDRALGGLRSGSLIPTFGASFQNNTPALISSFQISYTGEQWRLGAAGRADRLDFQFSSDATSLTTGTWTDFNALDFSSPSTTGTGALNGNLPANQSGVTAVFPDNWSIGATLWFRWTDLDASGSDDGLAVDNFSIRSVPVSSPVPESLPFGFEWAALLVLLGGARFLSTRQARSFPS